MDHRRTLLMLGLAAALSGCGGGEGAARFANHPRPPRSTLVAAAISSSAVEVSPGHLGAGVVRLVAANLTRSPQRLVLRATSGASFQQQTAAIPPAGTAELQARLAAGSYTVSVTSTGVRAAVLVVGPEGPSAQNQLLLP